MPKKNTATKLKNISTAEQLAALNKHIADENNHVFVLIFMEKCGPCMETRPEWTKLKTDNKDGSVIIADVNSALLNDGENANANKNTIQHVGQVSAFPTIKHIHKGKATDYSGSDRSHASLEKWIQDSVPLHKTRLKQKRKTKIKVTGGNIKKKTRKQSKKKKTRRKKQIGKLLEIRPT